MDLIGSIKEKAEYFSRLPDNEGIRSVIHHLEIAERHYESGKAGDDYFFNDVIYRSNQAFEGALKEAYGIIARKKQNNVTPYVIEKYFEDNDVLKERVLKLFTNYRKEWRNTSTHDYKLYFSEQEAFLGIVNISAFINILLDQMIESSAYNRELDELKKSSLISEDSESRKESILDRVTKLLISYSKEVPSKTSGKAIPRITEVELSGSLSAFFKSVAKDISLFQEYVLPSSENRRMRADFYLEKGNEKLIIELKTPAYNLHSVLVNGTEQLLNYLVVSNVINGVLYIPPLVEGEKLITNIITKEIAQVSYNIVQIYPENRLIQQENRLIQQESSSQ